MPLFLTAYLLSKTLWAVYLHNHLHYPILGKHFIYLYIYLYLLLCDLRNRGSRCATGMWEKTARLEHIDKRVGWWRTKHVKVWKVNLLGIAMIVIIIISINNIKNDIMSKANLKAGQSHLQIQIGCWKTLVLAICFSIFWCLFTKI